MAGSIDRHSSTCTNERAPERERGGDAFPSVYRSFSAPIAREQKTDSQPVCVFFWFPAPDAKTVLGEFDFRRPKKGEF